MAEAEVPSAPKRWKALTHEEQTAYTKLIGEWLDENYVAADDVSLLCKLVYFHYMQHCGEQELAAQTQLIFGKILSQAFPKVECVCINRGEKSRYYQGLDIRKSSSHYESVYKGRRVGMMTDQKNYKSVAQKRKLEEKNEGEKSLERDIERDVIDNWNKLHHEEKASHTASTEKWLDENYELSPAICLPRSLIYDHYHQFCIQQQHTPSPQFKFGKILNKKFKKIVVRRLGVRGLQRYYHMGLDIRESSDFYQTMASERIVSTYGKPKKSIKSSR